MEKFSTIVIQNWIQARQFAEKLLLMNMLHSMCSFSLDTDINGNLTGKGKDELLAIFRNKEITIRYFTDNWHPDFTDKGSRLDTKGKNALREILIKC